MKILLRYILRKFLGIAGIVILLWMLIPVFFSGSFHIGTLTGVIISVLMIIYGFFGGFINMGLKLMRQSKAGKLILTLIIALVAAILGLALACIVCIETGPGRTDYKNATVIILGCDVDKDGVGSILKSRLDLAIGYLSENPDSVCIVSGGQGADEPESEAAVMYEYLVDAGISPGRIYMEDRSTDTKENLEYSKEIIDEYNLNDEVVVVTSNYHVYRALQRAKESGLDAQALSCRTPAWLWPAAYIREMYGILELWFID